MRRTYWHGFQSYLNKIFTVFMGRNIRLRSGSLMKSYFPFPIECFFILIYWIHYHSV